MFFEKIWLWIPENSKLYLFEKNWKTENSKQNIYLEFEIVNHVHLNLTFIKIGFKTVTKLY